MTAAIATLVLGFVIGYLGQRSRLCFISGYRDSFLLKDHHLLTGVGGAFVGALGGYLLFQALGGNVPGFPMLSTSAAGVPMSAWVITVASALGVGIVGALAGGCPFRMHVQAAEGKKTYWFYLLGFYIGLVFYNLVTVHFVDFLRSLG